MSKYADTLNQKISAYTKLSGELNGMNTRTSGNLMSRDLIPPIVDEAHFIENRGSEYMSSVFAVINKGEAKNFETQVRSVSPAICYPMTQQGTIKCLSQDDQFCLYVLWVLNDSAGGEGERPGGLSATPKSDLLKAMRENRWQFRDEVEWDPEAAEAAKKRLNELDAEKKQEEARLAKWIDAVFSEAYINYVHLKAINAFIEAVLRYGLGGDGKPEYQAYIVEAKPKMESKTRAVLADAYEALGGGKDGTRSPTTLRTHSLALPPARANPAPTLCPDRAPTLRPRSNDDFQGVRNCTLFGSSCATEVVSFS